MKRLLPHISAFFLGLSCTMPAAAVLLPAGTGNIDLQGINVAQSSNGATATMESAWDANHGAANLIDGTTDGWFHNNTMAHSGGNGTTLAWAQVEFGRRTRAYDLVLFGRTDCCWERMSDYIVEFYIYNPDGTRTVTRRLDMMQPFETPTQMTGILPGDGAATRLRTFSSWHNLDTGWLADGVRIRRRTAGYVELAEVVVIGNYVTPAPAVLGLLGLGFAGVGIAARRRRKVA